MAALSVFNRLASPIRSLRTSTVRSALLIVLIAGSVASVAAIGQAQAAEQAERDQRLARWRDRREFKEGLVECEKQLERSNVSAEERAYWTRWQLEFLTLQILHEDDPFRADAWKKLYQQWRRYPTSNGQQLHDVEVDFQYWRGRQAEYELLGEWADLQAEVADFRARALDGLREVDRELSKLSDRLEKAPEASAKSARGQLTPFRSLKYRIAYQRGLANQSRSTLYPPGSADRVLLLTEALRAFSPLARLTNDSPFVASSQLHEIACQRLLGNHTKAAQLLNLFAKRHATDRPGIPRLQWLIERAELETAMQAGATQLAALNKACAASTETYPFELIAQAHWTILSGAVDRWQIAQQNDDTTGAEQWQVQALASQRALETNHSRLWVRRGEALLAKTFAASSPVPRTGRPPVPPADDDPTSAIDPPSSTATASSSATSSNTSSQQATSQNLEIEVRVANDAFTRGEKDRAMGAYEKAAATALQLGDEDLAFRLRFQAAAIVHEQQNHELAIERFRQLALDRPSHARAAEAHRIAILHAAAIASKSDQAAETYEQLLHEHLSQWAPDPTSNDVRFWLGKLLNQRGETNEAQAQWEAIRGEFKSWLELWPQLRAHYLIQWRRANQAGGDSSQVIQHVKDYWSRWKPPVDAKHELSLLECSALVYGAEWRVLYANELAYDLRPILERIITAIDCPDEIKTRAKILAGLLAALKGEASVATEHWKTIPWKSQEMTERVLTELDRAANDRSEAGANTLSTLLLIIVEQLNNVPAWSDNPDLWRFAARAHLRLGQREEAKRIYQGQATRHPKQAIWYAELATLEEQSTAPEDGQRALDHWRSVVRFSPEGSDLWFDGKLGIVRLLVKMQQLDRASEVIRVLETLHPEMGGEKRAAEFRRFSKQALSRP